MTATPPASATLPARSARAWLPDAACLAVLLAGWLAYVGPLVVRDRLRGYDICRDIASVVNIQHGQVFSDPAYVGETIWYPPLNPILMAAITGVSGISGADGYRWSQLVFNWLLPAGLFLVTRLAWGRRAAVGATVAMLLAMPWWQREVAHGQPSIHAIVWGWLALLLYARAARAPRPGWIVACGVFQGLSFWHHPFVPATLLGAFALQGLWAARPRPGSSAAPPGPRPPQGAPRAVLVRNALLFGLTLAVAAPILYLAMHGPVRNTAPREYLAAELLQPEVALLHADRVPWALWLWSVGVVGLITAVRRRDLPGRLLACILIVSLLGQAPGYARIVLGSTGERLPIIVPHEFQRIWQLAWAVCIGVGIDALVRYAGGRIAALRRSRAAVSGVTVAALLATGLPGWSAVPGNLRKYLMQADMPAGYEQMASWIRRSTGLNDVFACAPDVAFGFIGPETGRKAWITNVAHSNPRVDWEARANVMLALESAATPAEFTQIAQQHGIKYFMPSRSWMPQVLRDPALRATAMPDYFVCVQNPPNADPLFKLTARPALPPSRPTPR